MKKWLIAIAVIAVLLGGGGYYWYTQKKPDVVSEPVDAIPTSAVMIVTYPNLNSAWDTFEELEYFGLIRSISELDRYFSRNSLLDSIIRFDDRLKQAAGNSPIWSSYHVNSSDSLFVFHAIKSTGNSQQLLKHLMTTLGKAGIVSGIQIGTTSGFKLVVEEPFYSLYGTVANGLILLSSSENLLSQSLKQMQNGTSLRDISAFADATEVAGKNVEANIYFNYPALPPYVQRALKPAMVYHEELIEGFASWTELDLNLKSNGLTFNGFTFTTDSSDKFLDLLIDQKPRAIEFPDHLPANTASFVFFGVSDLISFSADYRQHLANRNQLAALEAKLDTIEKKYGIDLEQTLLAWMGQQHGVCITEPESASFAQESYWVFQARSSELALRLLNDLRAVVAKKNGTEAFVANVGDIEVGQLAFGKDLSSLLGEGYEEFGNPFYAIANGYVIFGTSMEAMEKYLQYLQADRTLAKELSFSRFADNLGSSFNVFTYHHLKRSEPIFRSYLNRKAIDVLDKNKNVVANFEALGTQITSTGKSFYSNIFLRYDPNWKKADESFWKGQLDSKARTTPKLVKNHVSGDYEVMVQDQQNQLYLFNLVGQELFKRELPEPIEGEIVQVDRFKNGKLQYVFNTKNFIYQLDRNGKDVEGFPIELNSPAETNLKVVEYDNKKDYRLLITCKNKHIYNYEIDGSAVKGWRHNKSSDPTIQPFTHLYVKGKDYLITGESDGKIHLLDRRGKNRVKVEKYVPASKNNHLQVFKSTEAAFTGVYITNTDGLIHRIALDGDVKGMDVGKFSPEHRFLVTDLDADGKPEFIFHDLNVLTAFNSKGEKVFEQRTDPSATAPRLIGLNDNQQGIGFCYPDSEQLILFGPDGNKVKGFPLSGNSEFDMIQLKDRSIVTSAGTENTVTIQTIE